MSPIDRTIKAVSFALESPLVGSLAVTALGLYHRDFIKQKLEGLNTYLKQQREETQQDQFINGFGLASRLFHSSNHRSPWKSFAIDLLKARLFQGDFFSVRKCLAISSYTPNPTVITSVLANRLTSVVLPDHSENSASPSWEKKIFKFATKELIRIGLWWGMLKAISHYQNLSPRLLTRIVSSLNANPPDILTNTYFARLSYIIISFLDLNDS